MRALTLTQPWATLVSFGQKQIETRSWYTPYRGPLAIHAAKGFPAWAREFAEDLEQCSAIEYGFEMPLELPLGMILATCRLVDIIPTSQQSRITGLTDQERDFGDFTSGRYAWLLVDVKALPAPIPARGALGLWEWADDDSGLAINPLPLPRVINPRQLGLEIA